MENHYRFFNSTANANANAKANANSTANANANAEVVLNAGIMMGSSWGHFGVTMGS